MYLYKATGDHTFLQLGRDAVESIEKITRVPCGYASVSGLRSSRLRWIENTYLRLIRMFRTEVVCD